MVQLGGAVIEWTTEKSSRKNVFQVRWSMWSTESNRVWNSMKT